MLTQVELGCINKDSFIDIWQSSPELIELRMRHLIPLSNFKDCTCCDYLDYCTGNCPGSAYTLTGKVYHPSPDACLQKFLAEGGSIP